MANICEFTLTVVAKSSRGLDKFKNILLNSTDDRRSGSNSDSKYFSGISECEETYLVRNMFKCEATFIGECRWSVYSCFRKGEHTYYNNNLSKNQTYNQTCLEDISKELLLDVEVFGQEPGFGFVEYHHIKDGEVLEDRTGYYVSPLVGDYETYEDFINDEDNKGVIEYVTKEIFDDAKKDGLDYVDIKEFDYPECSKIINNGLLNDYYITSCNPKFIRDAQYYRKYAEACKKYSDYIYEHIDNVQKVYNKLKDFLEDYFNLNPKIFSDNIKNHDITKFHPLEFEGYRARFFPVDEDETDYISSIDPYYFKRAWKLHYSNNPHHPEFYSTIKEINTSNEIPEMDDIFIAEMICDLWAMSIKFHNTPREYIESKGNEFKDKMNPKSYNKLIDTLYNIDVNNLMDGLYDEHYEEN